MKIKILSIIVLMVVFFVGCSKTEVVNEVPFAGFVKPANFPEPSYDFSNNAVTKQGFTLGKALFYEPLLSRNATISCGSCHIQSSAFTQHGHDVSHGIDDRLGTRNSLAIANLAWKKEFMWDGGIFNLDMQPFAPITAHEEMDESISNVIEKLKKEPKYVRLFNEAFGNNEITSTKMMKALSQFMLMCISSNSKYDKVMRKEAGVSFTSDELSGYALFKAKCSSCHTEPLFTDETYRDNGTGKNAVNDEGRYLVTLNESDKYKFKVPSLRNLKYTAPFMHSGDYLTVNSVLEHYRDGVLSTQNLDPLLNNEGILGIAMSDKEKQLIMAFLDTLNDEDFINNKLLAE